MGGLIRSILDGFDLELTCYLKLKPLYSKNFHYYASMQENGAQSNSKNGVHFLDLVNFDWIQTCIFIIKTNAILHHLANNFHSSNNEHAVELVKHFMGGLK